MSSMALVAADAEAYEDLCETIHVAAEKGETTFNFTHNYLLKSFPEDIKLLKPSLQVLHIDNCFELSTLPPAIGDLSNLRWLNVSYNKLKELPPEIAKLRRLERLHCNNNFIQQLPIELWALKGLQEIRCDSNQLKALPTGILFMRELRELFVNNNPLVQESDVEGAEVAELFPPVPYGDCSNCNVRFVKSFALCSFHDICGNSKVPISHYVCSQRCFDQLKFRLEELKQKQEEEIAKESPKKN